MKKFILVLVVFFLLTGCTAEYNLTIDDLNEFTYEENGTITSDNLEEIESIYDSIWPSNAYMDAEFSSENPEKIDGVDYYEVKSYYDGKYHVNYQFTFPSNLFSKSSGVYSGFPKFTKTYDETKNTTTLDSHDFSYKKFRDLEKLTVHITVYNKVLSHNATSVDGDTYTWIFQKKDFEKARMILQYENAPIESKDNTHFLVGTIVFLSLMVMCIVYVIRKKHMQR